MKTKILITSLIVFIMAFSADAQNTFSLESYTPKITKQNGANCYAFATAYMALTTQMAFAEKKLNPDSSFALSYDFIDKLEKYKEKNEPNFKQNVAQVLYNTESTADLGDLDFTFYVLNKYGAKRFNKYSNEIINENTDKDSSLIKFGKPKEVFNLYKDTFNTGIAEKFKKYIAEGKPIIISINQPKASCEKWVIKKKIKSRIKHIVTIIGYSNNNFLIQNNYNISNCSHYYTIDEISKIIEWAYVYDNIYELN